MPTFVYRGKTRQGSIQQGEVDAANQSAAFRVLRQRELFVTRLREKPEARVAWWSLPERTRIPQKDLVIFTYQLETTIKAGVPLSQSLEMLATHVSSSAFQKIIRAVKQKVESGSSLSGALRGHPEVFTSWYVSMIEAGEEGGMLDKTLHRLAEHTDKVWRLKQQVKLALAYPLFVTIVAVLVFWVLLIWVIPMFGTMFADWGDALPWPTAVVLEMSQWIRRHWFAVVVSAVVLGLGARLWVKTPSGRWLVEHALLRVPVVGRLWRNVAVVHVTRTLGALLGSGVPILRGLEIAQRVSGLLAMERALAEATVSVREGHTLADPLARSGMFPALVPNMVAVGESTGSLDEALEKIADLYAREVDRDMNAFAALLEPLIIVVLGLGIGVIIVAIYLPIFLLCSLFEG